MGVPELVEPPTGLRLVAPFRASGIVPADWWQSTALPFVEACESWAELDAFDATLSAFIVAIERSHGNALEYEKARRIVDYRRGVLLGPAAQGRRSDLEPLSRAIKVDVPSGTAQKYRRFAVDWPFVRDLLARATKPADVSQRQILKAIDAQAERRPTTRHDRSPAARRWRVRQARELVASGATVDAIADALIILPKNVPRLLKEIGIELPRPSATVEAARTKRNDRLATIRSLAADGWRSDQIGAQIGITTKACQALIRKARIDCPADRMSRGKRVDANRYVNGIVERAADIEFDQAQIDFTALDPARVADWIDSLARSVGIMRAFINRLRKVGERYDHAQQSTTNPPHVEDPASSN